MRPKNYQQPSTDIYIYIHTMQHNRCQEIIPKQKICAAKTRPHELKERKKHEVGCD